MKNRNDIARVLVLMGPPGAGRATQARLLAKRLSRPRISTGEILRELALSETPLGAEVRATQAVGCLVADGVVAGLVRERMLRDECRDGVVFHGFPATRAQADALEELAHDRRNVLAVAIVVPHEVLFERLAGRRLCPTCGEVYNVYSSPPLLDGVCDHDGARLVRRSDDAEETVTSRLMAYHDSTAPLFGYYRESGRLVEVDGDRSPGEVFETLCEELGL
jgi:adenylate kinase